ncbi:beta-ketoacyl synthase N-terminal-like domain-containing protein [Aequorivita sp. SDUM287046]|uniref:Beta-ketoacyl synthase N-terminal-like domain-containing protein n=1 Tax=Aequorivita aurantiaca TaxID=3053356 RepID=A0ABT8DF03_9FLAO|nr:beta-ketoacyl synthase N-terminal-like domain-containing protein [Aequorivita aurantiaca]MDN3723342.1 beta-ketoacyl synthase N-terminal-like domain-containing protein [Aequorivita aurantiaca]
MKKVFINSIASISSQKTFDNSVFLNEIIDYNNTVIFAHDPDYKQYIPPAAARRMAKGIKMGVVASKIAMDEAGIETVDAIITGTGMGCMIDSEKFVSAIIDNNEQYLTPTSFIQSTHNTVAGQIALGMECKAYNFTYVHSAISFESALLDAKMQLENDEAEHILVGGVEELGEHTTKVHRTINHIKPEAVTISTVLNSKTEGAVFSEGANFFAVSNEKRESCYAELLAVETYNTLQKERVSETIEYFLEENNLKIDNIDLVVLGNNGDVEFDSYYTQLSEGMFRQTQQVFYKHLVGENNTVSAFGIWLASKIIKIQSIPEILKINSIATSEVKTVLCYNQYRGQNHSLVLLKKC